jgi:hypothetical protein
VGLRLALAFVAVAVVAVGLVAVLAVVFTQRDIAALVSQRRNDLAGSLASDAVSTDNTGRPGWKDVDLRPALELAASGGAQAAVLDARGDVVASTLAAPLSVANSRRPLHLSGSGSAPWWSGSPGMAWPPRRARCASR